MRKVNICVLFLLILCISIICSGCSTNKAEKSYTITVDRYDGRELSDYSKYKVYIKGNRWRQDAFKGNSNTPYMSHLYDGKYTYVILDKNGKPAGIKLLKDDKNKFAIKHVAYPLFHWSENFKDLKVIDIFLCPDDQEPRKTVTTKSKYGFKCNVYEYPIHHHCNKNEACYDSLRKVCVDDKNMAVSISLDIKTTHSGKFFDRSVKTLNLVDIDISEIDNSLFKKPSTIITEKELGKLADKLESKL